jgi:hypothetical protein
MVDRNGSEFIDQDRKIFTQGALLDQFCDGGGFTKSEKTHNQIGWGAAFLRCHAIAPMTNEQTDSNSSVCGRKQVDYFTTSSFLGSLLRNRVAKIHSELSRPPPVL